MSWHSVLVDSKGKSGCILSLSSAFQNYGAGKKKVNYLYDRGFVPYNYRAGRAVGNETGKVGKLKTSHERGCVQTSQWACCSLAIHRTGLFYDLHYRSRIPMLRGRRDPLFFVAGLVWSWENHFQCPAWFDMQIWSCGPSEEGCVKDIILSYHWDEVISGYGYAPPTEDFRESSYVVTSFPVQVTFLWITDI